MDVRFSAEAEIGQDDANDDNQAYDINDGVHAFLFGDVVEATKCALLRHHHLRPARKLL
jgi:hypothetical protein